MPHQCTACDHVFPDGSKRMLAGCPNCGGKKFQFLPPGVDAQPNSQADDSAPAANRGTEPQDTATAEDSIIEAPSEPAFEHAPPEDSAQASARRTFASSDELPPSPPSPRVKSEAEQPSGADESDERPDLATLREELNQQFESIKILEPGQYELNLMGLYDRDEYIIALEEDGRYVIDVASASGRNR